MQNHSSGVYVSLVVRPDSITRSRPAPQSWLLRGKGSHGTKSSAQ